MRSCGRRTRRRRDSKSTLVAYDAECVAIACVFETAARRRNKLDHLTIFTDARAAILAQDSNTPSWQGNASPNSAAGARDPDRNTMVPQPLRGRRQRGSRRVGQGTTHQSSNSKYRPSDKQKPNAAVAPPNKKLAARFYQLKSGHCLTGQYLQWATRRPDAKCWWCNCKSQTREHLFKNFTQWKSQQKTLLAVVSEETGRGKDRFKISELFADERCSKAILDFPATTEVGRTARDQIEKRENAKNTLHRWRRKRGRWKRGRKTRGQGIINYRFFFFSFLFHMSIIERWWRGGRLYASMIKQKKKKRWWRGTWRPRDG